MPHMGLSGVHDAHNLRLRMYGGGRQIMSDCIIVNGMLMYFPEFDMNDFDYDARPIYDTVKRTAMEA